MRSIYSVREVLFDWQTSWPADGWKDAEAHVSDQRLFGCFKYLMLSRGTYCGATSPFPLSLEPWERSLSGGESSHKNAESCLALETSWLCAQA